jgi:hypothetical protein
MRLRFLAEQRVASGAIQPFGEQQHPSGRSLVSYSIDRNLWVRLVLTKHTQATADFKATAAYKLLIARQTVKSLS